MVEFKLKGDFHKLDNFLEKAKEGFNIGILDKYGKEGVEALKAYTPKDTGLTASSWYYEVHNVKNNISISFHNSNINKGVPIAIILQYGHATGNGGWVEGVDYINPALIPIFERISKDAWEEVIKYDE
jgi:hypothetical protein